MSGFDTMYCPRPWLSGGRILVSVCLLVTVASPAGASHARAPAWSRAGLLPTSNEPSQVRGGSSQTSRDPVYAGHMTAGVEKMRDGDFSAAAIEFKAALEARPGDLSAMVQLGRARLNLGDLAAAETTFADIERQQAELPAGPFWLGRVYLLQADPGRAEVALRRALQRNPTHYGALYYLGQALEAMGRSEGAEESYRAAVAQNPTVRLAPLALARLMLRAGRPGEAVDILEPLHTAWPDDPAVALGRGTALARAGRWQEAKEALERASGLGPDRPDIRYNLGLLALQEEQWSVAEEELQGALRLMPSHSASRLLLARVLEETGRVEEAARVLEAGLALAEAPPDRSLRHALGAMIGSYSPQSPRAIEIYRQLLEEDPGDDSARRALAEMYINAGLLEDARQLYEELLVSYPEQPAILFQVGYLRSQLGRSAGAREAFEKVLSQRPDAAAEYELAVLDLRKEDHASAEGRLGRALALDPHRTSAYFVLGRALRGLGKTEEAAQAMERFERMRQYDQRVAGLRAQIRQEPGTATAYVELGSLYIEGERWEAARELLRKAQRIDPGSAEAARLLRELDARSDEVAGGRR